MGYTFSRQDAQRIGAAVIRSEAAPIGDIQGKRGHHLRMGSSYSYEGPFAVIEKDSATVTILGYNASEDRYWRNYVDIGLSTPIELAEQDLTVTATGWVYMVLTQTGGTYNAITVATAATLPAQDNTHEYIRLAHVYVDGGAISHIEPWIYGGVVKAGRVY